MRTLTMEATVLKLFFVQIACMESTVLLLYQQVLKVDDFLSVDHVAQLFIGSMRYSDMNARLTLTNMQSTVPSL